MPGETDPTPLLAGMDPVTGCHHDHLFVPWERRHDAMAVLRRLASGG